MAFVKDNNLNELENEDTIAYFKIMHTIMNFLESTNEDEVNVAIDVASEYVKIHSEFAKLLVPKVNQVLATTKNLNNVDKFILLYKSMSYHVESAYLAYECCSQLWYNYPNCILGLMSDIVMNCPVLQCCNMEFLLKILFSDFKELSEYGNENIIFSNVVSQVVKMTKVSFYYFNNEDLVDKLWNLLTASISND